MKMKTEFENRVSLLAMEHYNKPLLGSASKSNDVRRDASVRESLRPLTQRIKNAIQAVYPITTTVNCSEQI